MESSSKRHKIEHSGTGLRHHSLINFQSRSTAHISTATTFVLQTDQLVQDARLDCGKTLRHADDHLYRLKEIIDAIEPHGPLPIAKATAKLEKKHGIIVPFPDPKPLEDAPYQLSYMKPSQCNVIGSYVCRTMVKTQPAIAIDMVVQMPPALFQDKDYINMRYFYRRAYYIAYIASYVERSFGHAMDISFEFLHDNCLLPVLVLCPRPSVDAETGVGAQRAFGQKISKKLTYSIRLIPCAPDNFFPWSKLTPTSSNNRNGRGDGAKESMAATPFYNSTLNAERTFITYLRVLTQAKKECAAFPDACILGRIWLQQRGFGSAISRGGFGHFEWAIILALLMRTGSSDGQAILSTSLNSVELFKAAVQFLATNAFSKKPHAFGAPAIDARTIQEPGPVLFDPTQKLNLAFKMTPWSAHLLQLYAKSTVALLADEAVDKFDASFIQKVDLDPLVFDAVYVIHGTDASSQLADSADGSSPTCKFSQQAHKVLTNAYGERAQLIHLRQQPRALWSLHAARPKEVSTIVVSVVFDSQYMSCRMEHGPAAEQQKEAAAFRQFWGDKAELRRFKDGRILECVEWTSNLPWHISEEIARFALRRHMKVTNDAFTMSEPGLSSVLSLSHLDKEAFDVARRGFSTLEQDIRSLEDMPLQVRQLYPISPVARYSSVEAPTPGLSRGPLVPMDVNLYFEASGKWPENVTAIQEAKIDFLLDIDKRLTAAHDNITTHLGREDRAVGIENLAYLDVVYNSGMAFRLRIHCDLEQTLLERDSKNKTLTARALDEAAEALARFRWLYTTLPLHTQTVATLCTRLHPLSASMRLVRHWFDCHKLSGHVMPELIELCVLHVFLKPYPWTTPSSPVVGFLRTLFFLSRWDWRDEPLIVDSADVLTADDRAAIRTELASWRDRDPHIKTSPALCVATFNDRSGLAYTRHGPCKLVASRMTRLAQAACKLVRDGQPCAVLFQSSLRDYDVLVYLAPKALRGVISDVAYESGARRPASRFKNLDVARGAVAAHAPLPLRAHPVDVLASELQRVFADSLVFFRGAWAAACDAHSDDDDAVLPAVWCSQPPRVKFRAGLPYNVRRVVDDTGVDDDLVELNCEAVLLEIARVGGDLIRSIEVIDENGNPDEEPAAMTGGRAKRREIAGGERAQGYC